MDLLSKNDASETIPWKDRLDELPLTIKEDILEDAFMILVYPLKIRSIRYILRSSMVWKADFFSPSPHDE